MMDLEAVDSFYTTSIVLSTAVSLYCAHSQLCLGAIVGVVCATSGPVFQSMLLTIPNRIMALLPHHKNEGALQTNSEIDQKIKKTIIHLLSIGVVWKSPLNGIFGIVPFWVGFDFGSQILVPLVLNQKS